MKLKHALPLVLIAALALSGCTMQVITAVNGDGSGKFGLEIGFTAEDLDMFAELGADTAGSTCDFLREGESDMPEGAEIVEEQRGDETWCIMRAPFADLDELRGIYADMDGVSVNTLELADGQFVYDIAVYTGDTGVSEFEAFQPKMMWRVTMPGRVTDHNADSADGNTLTWDLELGKTTAISAESAMDGLFGGDTLRLVLGAVLVGLCCLVLIGAGVGAFVLIRRRQAAGSGPAQPAGS